mmetsp:Transcript_15635/g.37149  ORF Transcript_15635/g.37149 Transcript_15635/m.37149 type:complete len:86 (-) Transcript_15635:1499-1756(-)
MVQSPGSCGLPILLFSAHTIPRGSNQPLSLSINLCMKGCALRPPAREFLLEAASKVGLPDAESVVNDETVRFSASPHVSGCDCSV